MNAPDDPDSIKRTPLAFDVESLALMVERLTRREPTPQDIEEARRGLKELREAGLA
jgi:hypothetical protein